MLVASYIYIGRFAPKDTTQLWVEPKGGGEVSLHVFSDGGWKVVGGGDGKSAYELAVEKGYSGTLDEWLDSLQGKSFTYDDLTDAQKAELAQDAVAAANRAAQAVETIEAAINDLDPSQSAEDAVVALAARQGVLENGLSALGPKIDGEIDLSKYDAERGVIENGVWTGYLIDNYKHKVITAHPNTKYTITGNGTNGTRYAFLKSYTRPASGVTPDFCNGYSSETSVGKDASVEVTTPSDCAYLYILVKKSTADCTPYVSAVGLTQRLNSLAEQIGSIDEARILALEHDIDGLSEVEDAMYVDAIAEKIAEKEAGPYIRLSDGAKVSSGNYALFKIINEGYTKVKAIVADLNTSQASIAFYSTDNISTEGYMSTYSVASQNSASYSVEKEIPEGCKLIVICNRTVLLNPPTVRIGNMLLMEKEDKDAEVIESIGKYFTSMDNNSVFSLVDKRILKSNGRQDTATGYSCSEYIKVKEGDSFDYSLYTQNSGNGLLCVYDEHRAFETCDVYYSTGDASGQKRGTWVAAKDGYIRVCSNTANLNSCYLRYSGITDTLPNRVAKLESDGLPAYWKEHLTTKVAEINAALSGVGNHGDSFFFFTDYHIVQNTGFTPEIIRKLAASYNIRMAVFGGDIMNTEADDNALIARFKEYNEYFKDINLVNVLGNHDYNPYGVLSSIDTIYPLLQKGLESEWRCTNNSREGYFCIDNIQQKMRYVFVNTKTNADRLVVDTDQLNWLASMLSTMEEGWYVVVIGHILFEWHKDSNDEWVCELCRNGYMVKAMCDALQSKSTGAAEGFSFDFTNAKGNVACVISGHTHIDTSVQSSEGYYIISTDRDAINYPPVAQASSRETGTYSEQVIDLVCIDTEGKTVKCVRIGGGSSRTFTFA